MTENFEERHKRLNLEQKRAVDTIEGPVMVVAGPGTGKTEILTLRIANILKKTDTAPENILALTFTDAAAGNMRRRLSQLIGSRAYRVVIETFHSFCNSVITNYPEYFPKIIGSGTVTEVEAMGILEHLILDLPLNILRPWGDPLLYVRDIYKKIEELKREGLSSEEFLEIITREEKSFASQDDLYHEKGAYKGKMKKEYKDLEKQIQKNKELCDVYRAYQESLHKRRLYDWSDMIMEVLKALRTQEDLKLLLQETHQYILVDEHQDTNNAQNKIVELLCDFHKNPNIFVVGDAKQAIFRFQGASVENFLHFKKLYPDAVLIELSQNYRSSQHILDAVHSLIPSHVPLVSGNNAHDLIPISIARFTKKSYELQFVAEDIWERIKTSVHPHEIAVIYRSNKEAFALADILGKIHVPYVIESDEDLLGEKFVRKFIALVDAVAHYGDDTKLLPALHIEESGIDPLNLYKLTVLGVQEKKSLYDLLAVSDTATLHDFGEKLKGWVKISTTEHLSQFFEILINESGLLQSMIHSKDASAFLGIERLFNEAKRIAENRPGATLADFIEYLDLVREHKLFIKRPKHGALSGNVHLMTAHKSKGQEFEYVYVIGATEKSFGPKRDMDKLRLLSAVYKESGTPDEANEAISDERRLFYVALSRAKKQVTVTYSDIDESGKEVLPSPFISEIREDRKHILPTESFEEKMRTHPEIMFASPVETKGTEIDRNFVSELFKAYPMSVSALNNYLDCPWKYFYRNLLRIPSAMQKHQVYGTAMHGAIEDVWRTMKDRDVTVEFVLDAYKRHLGSLGILSDTEFSEALRRGKQALTGWFAWAKPKITYPVMTEFTIKGVILSEGIVLGGKLDKVEMISDHEALVTDYKTGKQRSRNYIEGNTKDSNGDMKRQLQFYKLLLELHSDIRMKSGVIEFLEPDENNTYRREVFDITDEEVSDLKKTIERVAQEIIQLSFWDRTCDDPKCEYCGYRKLLKK